MVMAAAKTVDKTVTMVQDPLVAQALFVMTEERSTLVTSPQLDTQSKPMAQKPSKVLLRGLQVSFWENDLSPQTNVN
jgi:hypothetical protein